MGFCHSKSLPKTDRYSTNLLYIITTFYNPAGYSRRVQLHQEFCSRLASNPLVVIITVECAFEDKPFQVTLPNRIPYNIQIRSQNRLWLKECLMNIALEHLKHNYTFLWRCKYVACVDDDIEFSDSLFLNKLEESLQKYSIVQMFNQAYFLDINQQLLETFISLGYYYVEQNLQYKPGQYGHPGYAWATTKDNILAMGEFYDKGILGNGDKHMAAAFMGKYEDGFYKGFQVSKGYIESLKEWQDKIMPIFKQNFGYVDMEIRHHWHGSKDDRQYIHRWKLLMDYQYDPYKDLIKDEGGLYRLKDEKKEFEAMIIKIFEGRREDEKVNNDVEEERIPMEKVKGEKIIIYPIQSEKIEVIGRG